VTTGVAARAVRVARALKFIVLCDNGFLGGGGGGGLREKWALMFRSHSRPLYMQPASVSSNWATQLIRES